MSETATLLVTNVHYAVDKGASSTTAPAGLSLGADGHTLTIDPTDPSFVPLAVGDTRTIVVSYDVTDVHGATVAQTETVTISGTNDAPVVTAALADKAHEGDAAFTRDLLINAIDPDNGETATLVVTKISYSVDGRISSTTAPAGLSLGADGRTLTIDPTDPSFVPLAAGEARTIVVSYDVTDVHGATVAQTETITIGGISNAPVQTLTTGDDTIVTPPSGRRYMRRRRR
jgi:VCBS repeat-containing protein